MQTSSLDCLQSSGTAPSVSLNLLGHCVEVGVRTSGALTGSRVAGALGHVPIADSCIACNQQLTCGALGVGGEKTIAFCSWIDNMYTFSNTVRVCLSMLEAIENHLAVFWGLAIKGSSRSILICKGNPDSPADPVKWPVVHKLNVLGHFVQSDGGIREDWHFTESKMWGAFWANSGSSKCSKLSPSSRALLIYRAVFACVLWKISRWPFQKSIAQELDSTQCRMLAYVLPCVRSVDEDIDTFCRRRSRQARTVANRVGLWSIVWCQRVIAWSAHLKRGVFVPASLHQTFEVKRNDLANDHAKSMGA